MISPDQTTVTLRAITAGKVSTCGIFLNTLWMDVEWCEAQRQEQEEPLNFKKEGQSYWCLFFKNVLYKFFFWYKQTTLEMYKYLFVLCRV